MAGMCPGECRQWRHRERCLVTAWDETTGKFNETKWICSYCAQERVLNWVDPIIVSRLEKYVAEANKVKHVTVNAQFSVARLRRVTYNNGDTVDELILRCPPNKKDPKKAAE